MYYSVGSTVLGFFMRALLGFVPGVNIGWEERTPVVM